MSRGQRLGWLICLLLSGPASAETLHFITKIDPPLNWEEQGQSVGPMIDVLQAACGSLHITCTVEVVPWRRGLPMAEQGQVEGAFALAVIPEREALFYLSEPFIEGAYSFFGAADNPFLYQKPQSLAGHTIAVYGPSSTETVLEHALHGVNDAHVELEVSNLVVLRKLAGERYGREGLAFINRDVGLSLIHSENILGIKRLSDLTTVRYSIGLSRKAVSEATAHRFLNAIHALIQSGKISAILKKWGATPVTQRK